MLLFGAYGDSSRVSISINTYPFMNMETFICWQARAHGKLNKKMRWGKGWVHLSFCFFCSKYEDEDEEEEDKPVKKQKVRLSKECWASVDLGQCPGISAKNWSVLCQPSLSLSST